ncbi:CLUMA_CG015152, isoform A [Clunio marinus]|uniref:CLUMA_CG015152, isoform A n=1 Tax=Clunio marinus TaxID=568069 RepID=A0A1J1IPY9_9DIPT|nr:CLUMA_CG015152, isoform A [Clunio marinus]
MSLLPILMDLDDSYVDPWRFRSRYRNPLNDFALGINSRELEQLLTLPSEFRQLQQRSRDLEHRRKGISDMVPTTGKDGFQVCMDVQQFSPTEITVKTVDNFVVVEGKHEERQDEHGFITRQFTRRYALPKGYDAETVISTLSSDGVLTIKAPPPKNQLENKERVISIQQTGPAHLNVKENKKEDEGKPNTEKSG